MATTGPWVLPAKATPKTEEELDRLQQKGPFRPGEKLVADKGEEQKEEPRLLQEQARKAIAGYLVRPQGDQRIHAGKHQQVGRGQHRGKGQHQRGIAKKQAQAVFGHLQHRKALL